MIYLGADNIISSLGFTTEECWNALLQSQSGLRTLQNAQLYSQPFVGGKIDDERLQILVSEQNLTNFSRFEQLLILSIRQTLAQSNLDVSQPDCGLILASTKGNISLLSAENETSDELFLSHSAEKVSGYFGFSTQPIIVCNACISGVTGMIVAKRLIENGTYKHVVVAGGDELSQFVVSGFHGFKSVSADICRPYDASRDGLSLGEAFGSVLIASNLNLGVYTKKPTALLGGSATNDSNHISGPSRTGEELHFAIENAIRQAKLTSQDISFINAHGTATAYNDEMESKALYLSLLSKTPMQSLKSYFGHTLGASGVIETIICKKQLETDIILGIPTFETIGTPHPLNIASEHRNLKLNFGVKTASGFGGCNAAIVLGNGVGDRKTSEIQTKSELKIATTCRIDTSGVALNNEFLLAKETVDDFFAFIRKAYKQLDLEYRKFYKMDDLSKLGFIATAYLTRNIKDFTEFQPEKKGIVMANRSASLDTDINYRRNLDEVGEQEASPAIFVYTLPNVMLGEICIYWKMKGENTFFIQREFDKSFLMQYAEIMMSEQDLKYCIVGWCDLLGSDFEAEMYLVEKE